MIATTKTIGQCRSIHNQGVLAINANMTVSDLEQGFLGLFGLSVQVFRKSGKIWLETTVTDGWTLEKQNRHGEELSQRKCILNIVFCHTRFIQINFSLYLF